MKVNVSTLCIPIHGYSVRESNPKEIEGICFLDYSCLIFLSQYSRFRGMELSTVGFRGAEFLALVSPDFLIRVDALRELFNVSFETGDLLVPRLRLKPNFIDDTEKSPALASQKGADLVSMPGLAYESSRVSPWANSVDRASNLSRELDELTLASGESEYSGGIKKISITKGGASVHKEARHSDILELGPMSTPQTKSSPYFFEDGYPRIKQIYDFFRDLHPQEHERASVSDEDARNLQICDRFFGRSRTIFDYVLLFTPRYANLTSLSSLITLVEKFEDPDPGIFNDLMKPKVIKVFGTIERFLMNSLPGDLQYPYLIIYLYHICTFFAYCRGETSTDIKKYTFSGGRSYDVIKDYGLRSIDGMKMYKVLRGNPHISYSIPVARDLFP